MIHLKANPQDIDNAILEILRLHDLLITNRRRTTYPVTLWHRHSQRRQNHD
ncbi:hypothetical protein [Moraxella bovoculi]|uniref:hypothetical protein n=1 Tax=Moraxella bovoculi TaxID=386891 RepID=UPI001D0DBD8D|nr:hypothetical protein [Moraxella bovoculi]